ncbi:TonB-dependent receptor [Novosphingobium sp. FKTRR1]|uniref:TonB-dependent receptor n=1 Tax=Novosphingobium sp. FKTRR1 TaxID=2879118 RepID=UPI001CF092A6|nr:TonB-dependent receptor [Novosphingobium sp. FKTRR1]
MSVRKTALIASASAIALLSVPAFAEETAQPSDPIVVTGIRASIERAIEIKKVSDQNIDAISATDIGKLPDKNVADALQRLPGINTSSAASGEGGFDENDRVSIRGTSPSLASVTVDGHTISTGDWFILSQFSTVGRSISFDLLPSEIIETAVVSKTQNAGLLEGGVTGSIDIQTRSPLALKGLTIEGSLQGAYNSNTKKAKPQINGLIGWHNDADTFGFIAQGFYEQRSVRRYGQETLGYTAITAAMPIGAAHPSLIGVQAPTLIGSALFDQTKKRAGGFGAVEWKASDKARFKLSGFYSHLDATNANNNYMYWGSNELNNNLPTAYTVANNTLTSATWPALNAAGKPVNGLVVDNIVRPNASAQSWYVNLDGTFEPTDKLTITTQLGYTHGIGDTPTEPAFEVMGGPGISYAPSGNGWAVKPTTLNPASADGLANDWAWNETFKSVDHEIWGKVDAKLQIDQGPFRSVDFGVRLAQHERKVDGWDRGCSLGANGQCWGSPAMPFSATNPVAYPAAFNANALGIPGLLLPIAGNPDKIVAILNGITDGVHGPISSIVQPQNYYWPGSMKVRETDAEGFVMAHVGGEGWRGNVGVRLANTSENVFANGTNPVGADAVKVTTSAFGNYYINHIKHNYLSILPSINLTFDVAKSVQLRVSAAETMSRPDFSALGGTVSLTDSTLTGNGGNPNLKPVKATVFDGALEWYYAKGALAGISVFHDQLQSYVTYGTASAVYYSEFYKGDKTYLVTSPYNTTGELSGVELQVQQQIGHGFGFQANGTWVTGHDAEGNPLVGTSKLTYNLVGYYDKGPLSARVAYTYRSHYFVGLDRSSAQSQDNYGTLDASINFKVTPNLTFNLDAVNITNNKLKYYAETKAQPRAVYINGTNVFFGARFRF